MQSAAQQLSQWIEQTHPDFFDYLYSYVQRSGLANVSRKARLRGFGDDDFDFSVPDISDVMSNVTVDPIDLSSSIASQSIGAPDTVTSQYTPSTVDIPVLSSSDLQSISPMNTVIGPQDSGSLDVSTDNSGSGLLQSLGSGIASAASSVGSFLTSSQGLTTVANLAKAYFQLQTSQVAAQMQTQVLNSQLSRAAQGQAPNPITYVTGANGQLIPVYNTSALAGVGVYPSNMPVALQSAISSGQSQLVTLPNGSTGYTIPQSIFGALGMSTSLSSLLPWILLIVGGLIAAKELSR
jgi:hypothetical protein